MHKLPFNLDGFHFSILNNPRPSDYVLGEIKCDICGCQTSIYLNITDEALDGFSTSITFCKSCLTGFVDAMNNHMLDLCKKGETNAKRN